MAKISARGATELARWKNGYGSTIVLASDGRLLKKVHADDGYTVWHRKMTLDKANRLASTAGYRPVTTRN